MRKLKEEDYTCRACYQRVKDCVCAFASPKDMQAEIARLLAVEVAAKEIINQCFCVGLIENTIQCECCKAEAETLKDFPHKPNCPVLVINPIGDKR